MKVLNDMEKSTYAIAGIAVTVIIVIAILTGFKSSGSVDNTTVDSFITGIEEYANWISIIVIGIVGLGLLALFMNRKK